jgi:hypothetical protein
MGMSIVEGYEIKKKKRYQRHIGLINRQPRHREPRHKTAGRQAALMQDVVRWGTPEDRESIDRISV